MEDAEDKGAPSPRSIELESKFTFLEETVDALHEVILDQGKSIDTLETRMAKLEARFGSIQGAAEGPEPDPLDEKPPHY